MTSAKTFIDFSEAVADARPGTLAASAFLGEALAEVLADALAGALGAFGAMGATSTMDLEANDAKNEKDSEENGGDDVEVEAEEGLRFRDRRCVSGRDAWAAVARTGLGATSEKRCIIVSRAECHRLLFTSTLR